MGSGLGKSKQNLYKIQWHSENDIKTFQENSTEEVKKPMLKKSNSHPDIIGKTTVFCPYIDVKVKSKGKAADIVQRSIIRSKSSLIGKGVKLDYKKSEFFEYSGKYPWLMKNAHLISPNMKEFEIDRTIGAGKTSVVNLVHNKRDKFCVIKMITKDYIFKKKVIREVMNERDILYDLDHPFLMKLFSEFEDNLNAYFVFEYVPGGELRNLLSMYTQMTNEMAKFYMAELLVALEYIHSQEIAYRDLRPENILIAEDGHIKICDFGSAKSINTNVSKKLYTICCTPLYLSPELLNSKYEGGYGLEVDWWAYGIIFYELLMGKTPFCNDLKESQYEILIRILQNKLSFPFNIESTAKDIISKILFPQIDKRFTKPKDIKSHEFFKFIEDWEKVPQKYLVPPFLPTLTHEGDSRYFAMDQQSAKHWKLGVLEDNLHLF